MDEIYAPYIPGSYSPTYVTSKDAYHEAIAEMLDPPPSILVFDMPKLSGLMGGFRAKEYSILCGSTGTGKTTLIANWSASWIRQRVPHFVASVETGKTDFIRRVISVMEKQDLNSGNAISLAKAKEINTQHGDWFKQDILYLAPYEDRFDVDHLMADIAWMVKNKGIKIALIDNLNFFMDVKRGQDQNVEMDRVTHALVTFSKQIPVHIVMLMHPRKTDNTRVESEFDIKGSSTAVQEAYNIFLLNRATPEDIKAGRLDKYSRELKIAKLRRRGKAIGSKVIFSTTNGVVYDEKEVWS